MDIREYNRGAWDYQVEHGNEWTVPVSTEVIADARQGRWEVLLTETKPVPREWFPELRGLDVLCLASGGGQQAPVLAAAGANVTVLDNSPKQLEQDRKVAERESLNLVTVEGDMADLSGFIDQSFDLIFHPCSNLFIRDVRPVWKEAFRVLRSGGVLLAGFLNPAIFLFDGQLAEQGVLQVRHKLPYSDVDNLTEEERLRFIEQSVPLEFGHTLEDQLGGQTDAGFAITGFYEDHHRTHAVAKYTPTYIATRAIKL
ncbi:MAG TPA: class I SAM-dependent methyltransferase [Pyrinomonadaceae bacterium]|jgi:SAM-dependent methyltransferase|nr:class I SAM-dependent methyltransferase [Pyrinomonadaceae bacterium]